MIRILYYEKIKDLVLNFFDYQKLYEENLEEFYLKVVVDWNDAGVKALKGVVEEKRNALVKELIINLGIKRTLKVLQQLDEMIKPNPPSNNLLRATIEEIIDVVKKLYKSLIYAKIPKLYSLFLLNKKDDALFIKFLNDESTFFWQIDNLNNSDSQETLWEMPEKKRGFQDSLNVLEQMKREEFVLKNIVFTNGWTSFNDFAFWLIEYVSKSEMKDFIDQNFVFIFLEICNNLYEKFFEVELVEKQYNQLKLVLP